MKKPVLPGRESKKTSKTKSQYRWMPVMLFILAFGLYANTLYNEYCLDDVFVITENTSTQKGFAGIKEHLTQDLLFGYKHIRSNNASSAGWRPLSMITFSMETGLFGKNKPGISHLINVLLFALIVVILFRLLDNYLFKDHWLAFISAFFFALHPIHTEVVANLKSRDELLCLLFSLLSIIQLWKYLFNTKTVSLFLSAFFYFISLTSKESSITMLAGIPIILYFYSDRKVKSIVSLTAVFIFSAVIYLLVRNAVVPFVNVAANTELINNAYMTATPAQALATKFYILLLYLKLLFYPLTLSFDYSYNQIPFRTFSDPPVLLAVLIYGGMILFALTGIKRKNIYSFCILMFLVTLSIGSNLFYDIGMMMGERILFLPSVFFCIAIAAAILSAARIAENKFHRKRITVAMVLLTPLTAFCSWRTVTRNAEWKNDRTLAMADITKSPNSARMNNAAGAAYLYQALQDNAPAAPIALSYFLKSIAIYPDNNDALLNLSVTYFRLDSTEQGMKYAELVRSKNPGHPKLKFIDNYLAGKFLKSAIAFTQTNMADSAAEYYNLSLKYALTDSMKLSIYYNMGGMYYNAGAYEKSLDALGKVLSIDSSYMNAQTGYRETMKMILPDKLR